MTIKENVILETLKNPSFLSAIRSIHCTISVNRIRKPFQQKKKVISVFMINIKIEYLIIINETCLLALFCQCRHTISVDIRTATCS